MLQIPVLLKSPQLIVEALYWIDDIISKSGEGENKSLVLTEAYKAEKLKLPQAGSIGAPFSSDQSHIAPILPQKTVMSYPGALASGPFDPSPVRCA